MADTLVTREGFLSRGFSRVSWGGIFAGAIATIAFGIVFMALGAAIGLTSLDPAQGEWGLGGGWASGIWALCSIVLASFLGAMVGTRCSAVDEKSEGGLQGLFIWALAFLAMLAFTTWMATRAATATTQLATSALQAAGAAAGAADLSPEQLQNLRQQAQQALPGGQQLQQEGQQVAQTAVTATAAASWWFFVSAFLAAIAGWFGGVAGMPRELKKPLEVRRRASVTPTETRV